MAAWQADFELRPDDTPFLPDYRARLSALLPAGRPWATELETGAKRMGTASTCGRRREPKEQRRYSGSISCALQNQLRYNNQSI
jgi:hypothetical protein